MPAIPLDRSIPGLVRTAEQVADFHQVGPPRALGDLRVDSIPENTSVELEEGAFVILGHVIGAGKQGIVYSVGTCEYACVKLCRNAAASKQFRRELLGLRQFDALGISYPSILGADSRGTWIVKQRWGHVETGESLLASNHRILPPRAVASLHEYVLVFKRAGLCADWMPSNVVFHPGGCATFETSVWPIRSYGWTFERCFLPAWLPHGVAESSLEGFPPYTWLAANIKAARRAWMHDPDYRPWRDRFGVFPAPNSDWWVI